MVSSLPLPTVQETLTALLEALTALLAVPIFQAALDDCPEENNILHTVHNLLHAGETPSIDEVHHVLVIVFCRRQMESSFEMDAVVSASQNAVNAMSNQ